MGYLVATMLALPLLLPLPVRAADVTSLAGCTPKVFKEINRTSSWSGKAPAGCTTRIAVQKRADGAFVSATITRQSNSGWVRTTFSAAMGYAEIAKAKALALAAKDIQTRAAHLERCLDSLITSNDPLDCRYRSTRS